MWVAKIQEEEQQKALSEKLETIQQQVSLLFLTPLTPPPHLLTHPLLTPMRCGWLRFRKKNNRKLCQRN